MSAEMNLSDLIESQSKLSDLIERRSKLEMMVDDCLFQDNESRLSELLNEFDSIDRNIKDMLHMNDFELSKYLNDRDNYDKISNSSIDQEESLDDESSIDQSNHQEESLDDESLIDRDESLDNEDGSFIHRHDGASDELERYYADDNYMERLYDTLITHYDSNNFNWLESRSVRWDIILLITDLLSNPIVGYVLRELLIHMSAYLSSYIESNHSLTENQRNILADILTEINNLINVSTDHLSGSSTNNLSGSSINNQANNLSGSSTNNLSGSSINNQANNLSGSSTNINNLVGLLRNNLSGSSTDVNNLVGLLSNTLAGHVHSNLTGYVSNNLVGSSTDMINLVDSLSNSSLDDLSDRLNDIIDGIGRVPIALNRNIIDKIPVRYYSDEKYDQCNICLSEYEKKEKIRVLPCEHIYHPECIDKWFKESTLCPVCRKDMRNLIIII